MRPPQIAPVSVVIPCYRCAETIGRAVDSVAEQTLRPAEMLLVDDCSSDETLSTLLELRQRVGRDWIRVVPLDRNRGPGFARNIGWELATQRYLAFLDADDAWMPDKVDLQYRWMAANPAAVLTAHGHLTDDSETRPTSRVEPLQCVPIRPRQLLWRNLITTSTVMLRRDLVQRFDAEQRFSEDFWLWLQIAFSGQPMFVCTRKLTRQFKAPFGAAGLSARLWQMEKGELGNFGRLRAEGKLTALDFSAAVVWSLAKYVRRTAISSLSRQR